MHRFVVADPLSALAPLGNLTLPTSYRVYSVGELWHVAHWNPLAVSADTFTPSFRNVGRPVAEWHLAHEEGTSPSSSQ